MLRLLTKQEVTQKKSEERRREIDEGVKLSRRVDSLREIVSEEEKALTEFRNKTVATINAEITALTDKATGLLSEVHSLERRRDEALKPLTDEHKALDDRKAELDTVKRELDDKRTQLQKDEDSLERLRRELKAEETRIENAKERAHDLLSDAIGKDQHATIALRHAEKVQADTERTQKNVLKELRERDANCATKERELALKEEWLDRDRAILEKERIRLSSLRGTLERALNRLKK